MGELVFINIGHAGIRIADACWELFCLEHEIDYSGIQNVTDDHMHFPQTIFTQLASGRYVPRTLHVDTDRTTVDQVKSGKLRDLFNKKNMVSGKEDCSSNFTRGQMTIGKDIIDETTDCLRKITEGCEHLQGFIFVHSIGGGTGSGFTSLLSRRMRQGYYKKIFLGATVYPSDSTLTSIVEPYNAILSTDFLKQNSDLSMFFRNSQITSVLDRQFGIENPSFTEINRYIAQTISSVTSCMRFPGVLNCDLRQLQTNLVPYPRAHYLMTSYINQHKLSGEMLSTSELTQKIFTEQYSPYLYQGSYMSSAIMYRGNFNHMDIVKELSSLKEKKLATFVDWVPNAFKVGMCEKKPAVVSEGGFQTSAKSICVLSNNSAVQRYFNILSNTFDRMYMTRAFVHWYVGEGLSEEFFGESRQSHAALEKDYEYIEPAQFYDDDMGEVELIE